MPVDTFTVSQSTDDGIERDDTGVNATGSGAISFGQSTGVNFTGAVRFRGTSALAGMTINAATLRFVATFTAVQSDACEVRIQCEDNATPSAFTSTDNEIGGRTRRAAFVDRTMETWNLGSPYEIDVTSIIQDLVDALTPTDIAIFLQRLSGTGLRQARSYDSGSDFPELEVDYSAPPVDDNAARRQARVASAPLAVVEARSVRHDRALFLTGQEPPPPPPQVQPRRVAAAEVEPVEARAFRPARPVLFHTGRTFSLWVHSRRRAAAPDLDVEARAVRVSPHLIDWAKRYHTSRGLYRVFNAAVYRLYRSSSAPPEEGDSPWATSATLPATPADTFADGTWYLAVSYFNGVVDSGFLPIGLNGERYRVLVVASSAAAGTPPVAPLDVRLELRAGGVVRVVAVYAQSGDDRADSWSIGYTTDGSTPAEDTPTATQAFSRTSGIEVLTYDLPAQTSGTAVKVRVQVRRGSVYSNGSTVLTATADATGPAQVPGGDLWSGQLPEEVL